MPDVTFSVCLPRLPVKYASLLKLISAILSVFYVSAPECARAQKIFTYRGSALEIATIRLHYASTVTLYLYTQSRISRLCNLESRGRALHLEEGRIRTSDSSISK